MKPMFQTAWDLYLFQRFELPTEIQQCRCLRVGIADFVELNEKDVMRADFALIDNAAVQVRQCVFNFELSGLPSMPNMVFEAFFGREVGQSGKVFGDILLAIVECVDAQITVALQDGNDGGLAVDAQHDRRRLVGNGGYGSHGNAIASCFAVCRDDVYASGTGGHGISK